MKTPREISHLLFFLSRCCNYTRIAQLSLLTCLVSPCPASLHVFYNHSMRKAAATVARRAVKQQQRRCLHAIKDAQNGQGPPIQITTLPNRIRVATEATPGHFSGVGLFVDAGSRYETPSTSGVSHFLDRLAFKASSGVKVCASHHPNNIISFRVHARVQTLRWQRQYTTWVVRYNVPLQGRLSCISRRISTKKLPSLCP